MVESSRLGFGMSDFWLCPLVFDGPMAVPGIGKLTPSPPSNPTSWPTYPVIVAQGIPFNFYAGSLLLGQAESFASFVKRSSKDWTIRAEPLRPADDPFLAFEEAMQKYKEKDLERDTPLMLTRPAQYQDLVQLIREVYPITLSGRKWPYSDAFAKDHSNFMALGVHWDSVQQRYVLPGGGWLHPSAVKYPVVKEIVAFPQGEAHLLVQRTDPSTVEYQMNLVGSRADVDKMTFAVLDASTRKDLDRPQKLEHLASALGEFTTSSVKRVLFEFRLGDRVYRSHVVIAGAFPRS